MKGVTHLSAGVITGAAISVCCNLSTSDTLIVLTGSAIGSLIPDIDICTSKMGRLMPPASFLIQTFIGHRTLFHAPLPYIVLLSLCWLRIPSLGLWFAAAGVGILTHLLLDMLNPSGVPLLWPSAKRFSLATLQSGGLVDKILSLVLSIGAITQVLYALQHGA